MRRIGLWYRTREGEGTGSREPGAGSREPGAGSREPGAGSREPGAGSRFQRGEKTATTSSAT
ncbi:hypothetical protein EGI20_13805 [Aquitalea sp. S1-19]|nr:hypothetical protein [Aquitalea sp. S1-19]